MFGSLIIFPCLKPFLFTSFLDLDNIFIVQASFYKIICLYMELLYLKKTPKPFAVVGCGHVLLLLTLK